jgi:hypothetical protein
LIRQAVDQSRNSAACFPPNRLKCIGSSIVHIFILILERLDNGRYCCFSLAPHVCETSQRNDADGCILVLQCFDQRGKYLSLCSSHERESAEGALADLFIPVLQSLAKGRNSGLPDCAKDSGSAISDVTVRVL